MDPPAIIRILERSCLSSIIDDIAELWDYQAPCGSRRFGN